MLPFFELVTTTNLRDVSHIINPQYYILSFITISVRVNHHSEYSLLYKTY